MPRRVGSQPRRARSGAGAAQLKKRFAELSLGNSILSNELQQAHAWVAQRQRAATTTLDGLGSIQVCMCVCVCVCVRCVCIMWFDAWTFVNIAVVCLVVEDGRCVGRRLTRRPGMEAG